MTIDPQRRPSTGTLAAEALWAGLTGFGGGLDTKRRLLDLERGALALSLG